MRNFKFLLLCLSTINTINQCAGKSPSSSKGSSSKGSGSSEGGGGGRYGGGGGYSYGGGRSYTSNYYYYYYYSHHHSGSDPQEGDSPIPPLPAPTDQDKIDAADIVNAQFDEKVIGSKLPFREPINRQVINHEIAVYNHGDRLIKEKYLPNHKKNPPFKDLCFALVNDPVTVLTMFLGEFLHRKDETFIIIVLTLCQDRSTMHYIYDHTHKNHLNKRRRKQRHPFANLMKVWIDRDRDPEGSAFTPQDIQKDVDSMKNEYPHWKKTRDSIENTLIKKCYNFSLSVVQEFEADLKITIEEAISQKIKNHDLVDAYTSLAMYVKDKYNYMATTLQKYCDGKDRWAVWIMMIGSTDPADWPKIDVAFKKINKNVSLKDHILKVTENEADRIPFEMMAAVIDPTYKPSYMGGGGISTQEKPN
ncbi:uncharacterized protein LOC135848167 [Planococcus citri]|uniref:uncharacterized protein LOC135848167 n=1 Tax=Planococcus citri TaxID=170843 RepID=UPI0031F8B130